MFRKTQRARAGNPGAATNAQSGTTDTRSVSPSGHVVNPTPDALIQAMDQAFAAGRLAEADRLLRQWRAAMARDVADLQGVTNA